MNGEECKMSEKEHTIQATLTPSHYEKFLKLKQDLGVKFNATVMCLLIANEYQRLVDSGRDGK